MKTVFKTLDDIYRIVEIRNDEITLEEAKKECIDYDAEGIDSMSPKEWRAYEIAFKKRFKELGVFAFVVEKWNPTPGEGYQDIDESNWLIGDHTHHADFIRDLKQYIRDEIGPL